MNRRSLMRLSGVCGVVGPVLGVGLVLAATVISPSFRWERNALSDLGVAEPDAALLFNAGVVIAGVLFLLLTVGIAESMRGTRARLGIPALVIGGLSLILVGIFTEAYGALHTAVSMGYFILVPLGVLVMGLASSAWGATARLLSIAAGILSLLAISTTQSILSAVGLRMGFAVPEIIEALILAAWAVSTGLWLLRRSG